MLMQVIGKEERRSQYHTQMAETPISVSVSKMKNNPIHAALT